MATTDQHGNWHEPRGVTAGELVWALDLVKAAMVQVERAERRYNEFPQERRRRIEERPTSPLDLEWRLADILAEAPVAERERRRDTLRRCLEFLDAVQENFTASLREAGRRLDVAIDDQDVRHLADVARFRASLSPSDRYQWDEFFEDVGRERPRTPNYLICALRKNEKGLDRAARQDWDLTVEQARRSRLEESGRTSATPPQTGQGARRLSR